MVSGCAFEGCTRDLGFGVFSVRLVDCRGIGFRSFFLQGLEGFKASIFAASMPFIGNYVELVCLGSAFVPYGADSEETFLA